MNNKQEKKKRGDVCCCCCYERVPSYVDINVLRGKVSLYSNRNKFVMRGKVPLHIESLIKIGLL